jgi:GPH family glycoside/pentoside/hexuronide:cation symporter
MSRYARLGMVEKIGYAGGDFASNLYWRTFDLFLLMFYTDVFGIPAAALGTMMLVTRIIDAFTDPLMAAAADRTRTRFGKFRPYLLLGVLPLAAAGVLTFTVPDTDQAGKLWWAYGTYVVMILAYTFINVPYGALMGVMTGDSQQRTTLTSFRFIGAFSGGTLVAYFTPQLVEYLGGGDDALGWQLTMAVYGVIAALMFVLTFTTSEERIATPIQQQQSVKQDLIDLSRNKPWLVLFALALVIMMTISLRGASGTYYFKYFANREDLIGSFSTAYLLSLAAGAALTPLMTRLVDKKTLLLVLMSAVTLLSMAFFFVKAEQIDLMFALQIAIGFCLGPKSPLVFSMYADCADYNEFKTGRRATAMTFAAAAFSQKLGGALAGATIGWVLASLGYQANQVQSNASELGIVLLMTLIPGVFAALSLWLIKLYPLDPERLSQLQESLARASAEQRL